MGSGFSGKYQGTWSSPAGEELRAKVLEAVEAAGGMLVGGSVVDLAEALVRTAAGESPDEVDFPEMSDVALDLALDALSVAIPGGGQASRTLCLAVKVEKGKRSVGVTKGASKMAGRAMELLKDESGYIRLPKRPNMSKAEYAIVNSNLNNMYHARLAGRKECDVAIGNYRYRVAIHDFDDYTVIRRKRIE